MGYWSTAPDGTSFAGDGSMLWGDTPADIFGRAIKEVIADFTANVGRGATVAELRAGFEFSLGAMNESDDDV